MMSARVYQLAGDFAAGCRSEGLVSACRQRLGSSELQRFRVLHLGVHCIQHTTRSRLFRETIHIHVRLVHIHIVGIRLVHIYIVYTCCLLLPSTRRSAFSCARPPPPSSATWTTCATSWSSASRCSTSPYFPMCLLHVTQSIVDSLRRRKRVCGPYTVSSRSVRAPISQLPSPGSSTWPVCG